MTSEDSEIIGNAVLAASYPCTTMHPNNSRLRAARRSFTKMHVQDFVFPFSVGDAALGDDAGRHVLRERLLGRHVVAREHVRDNED